MDDAPPPLGPVLFAGLSLVTLGLVGFYATETDPEAAQAPMWVARLANLAFVLVGLAVLGFLVVRGAVAQTLGWAMAVIISGTLTAAFGWAAFGPGERAFRGSASLPAVSAVGGVGDIVGRGFFGIVAVLMGLLFVAVVVKAARAISRGKS